MPEPLATPEIQDQQQTIDEAGNIIVIKSRKTGEYLTANIPARPDESLWHPVKALEDLIQAINENTRQTELLLKQMQMERDFIDIHAQLGLTIGFTADYQDRKYIYAKLSGNGSVDLTYNGGNQISVTPGVWKNISPPRGSIITIVSGSDVALQTVTFRLCDFILN